MSVSRLDRIRTPSILVPVEELEDVAKHLSTVSTFNLLDDEGDFLVRIHPSHFIGKEECLLHKFVGQFLRLLALI